MSRFDKGYRLRGRRAMVTGAANGIGAAISKNSYAGVDA